MINKITNIVHIIVLLIYSLIMTVFNKINGIIKIKKYIREENFQNNNKTPCETITKESSIGFNF
jgi:hypothetical protein